MNSKILSVVAFFIAIGIFFAYVNPTWSGSIATTKAAIAADEQALLAASAYAAKQVDLTAEENLIDPTNLAQLAVFLPDAVDNVGLILDLNTLAAHSGISLSNIDVIANSSGSAKNTVSTGTGAVAGTASAVASPVGSVDLSLSAVGTYAAFHVFLSGIERSARLLDIRDLVVKGSDNGVYTYQMTIRFYWLR